MHESLRALLALQEIDRHIFKVEAELRRLPRELDARRMQVERIESEIGVKQAQLREQRATIKEIEDLTTQQRQRLRKLEGEAMKNTGDVALLAAYDHEIRGLKRTISQAEEDGLGHVDTLEETEAALQGLQTSLEDERRVFEELEVNVERELGETEERLAQLRSQIEGLAQNDLPPEHLTLYRGLLATREGEAMAALDGRFCQGCYVEIPKNLLVRMARGMELVQCPSCARILYTR
jgi:predicted  nucleic acid-binding Zn-ribbon protein